MDSLQIRIIKDLMDSKVSYLNLCKKQKNYDTIQSNYDDFSSAFSSYYSSLLSEVTQRQVYQNELKKKKIDPYIAGGMVNGIAGAGVGIYTAFSTAQNNAKIDYNRKALQSSVANASANSSASEKRLLNKTLSLYDLLADNEEIRKIMEEKSEKIYNDSKNQMNIFVDYNKMEKIAKEFESLGNYKDAIILAQQCYKKVGVCKWRARIMCSLAFALFVIIVSGVYFIFPLAFIICLVYMLFYIK